ncbi:PDZ domain-containing protein [Streptomyces californicus]
MKLVGAREAGARYFLTPDENCASAAADAPDGLTLVRVKTIEDATKALEQIRSGKTAGLASCSTG